MLFIRKEREEELCKVNRTEKQHNKREIEREKAWKTKKDTIRRCKTCAIQTVRVRSRRASKQDNQLINNKSRGER